MLHTSRLRMWTKQPDRQVRPNPRALSSIAVMGATLTALVLLVLARGHWWPPGNDWHFTAAAAALLLLTTGCIWAVSTITVLRRDHRGAWWMLTWPLVTALGVIMALVSAPRFDNGRLQFEAIAQRLLTTPDSDTLDSQRIGRFEVDRVYEMPTGEVYFTDSRRGLPASRAGSTPPATPLPAVTASSPSKISVAPGTDTN